MHLHDLNFELPDALIAQQPAEPRDSARLLVYNRISDTITHSHVSDLGSFLCPHAVLVGNNSRVRKARLYATIQEKPVEVIILNQHNDTEYICMLGGNHLYSGSQLCIWQDSARSQSTPLTATIIERQPGKAMNTYILEFKSPQPLEASIEQYGHTPLPPYITQSTAPDERYQTVYASQLGSAAAPTAGLHITPTLLNILKQQGITWQEITLHVGLGTFLPLRQEEVKDNLLHSEETYISSSVAKTLEHALHTGTQICAVGTTSARTLESHWHTDHIHIGELSTNIFIYPGYNFRVINALLTNFHLPKSSLLLLVAALLASDPVSRKVILTEQEAIAKLQYIYAEAITHKYRFFSFGDAMLIL